MRKILLSLVLCALAFVPVSAARVPMPRSLPGSACAGSATDSFTRADAGTLGANYAGFGAAGTDYEIVSNKASSTASQDFGGDYWTADSFNDDQCAKATIASAPSVAAYAGVMVRASGSTTTFNAYGLLCNDSLIRIEEFNNSADAPNTLGANLTGTCANTDVMMIQVTGTTIEAFKNGSSLGTRTDATITSGSAGVYAYSLVAGTMTLSSATFDNMSAGAASFIPAIINAPIRGGGLRSR